MMNGVGFNSKLKEKRNRIQNMPLELKCNGMFNKSKGESASHHRYFTNRTKANTQV
jgi:hypothetical protein